MAKVNRGLNLEDWNGVFVIGEQRGKIIKNITVELIGEGRKLANKLQKELTVLILGNELDDEIERLAHYGADKIIYVENPLLEIYTTDAYSKVITEVLEEKNPEIVLIGATTLGRDLAPRIAGKIGTGLTADCTKLEIDETDNKLLQTRPAFGGNLMATIICPNNRPQMSTVRPGVMDKAQYVKEKSTIEKINPSIDAKDILSRVVDVILKDKEVVSLTDAKIIVAGGRGISKSEGFEVLKQLADKLGGVVAASRAAVDSGWIDHDRQVGQTGTTVKPKLYIACGISGAIQHIAGMGNSETIIAINKDPDAPIHEIAHYSIVEDYDKIIPSLIQAIEDKESILIQEATV
ncbi:electron transfer flavoprotein subunit alpha/FixB family protein [Romboutsia sp.]|uniref:electron transfer flavoprotein subunit alpha/FixB family protein n=1 Tax=Romboutsia sp. TaxID=1965302 RepID=UPI003F3968B8